MIGWRDVFSHLLERLGLKGFRYSPLGLSNGILEQMLAEVDLRASGPPEDRDRALGGRAGGLPRYGVDQRKAEPVRQHVVQLFDELLRVHEFSRSTGCGCRPPP